MRLIAQFGYSTCIVYYFSSKGTGFIGFLRIGDQSQYVLVTCNHVVPTEDDARQSQFYFNYMNSEYDPLPYEASKILDMTGTWFWFDQDYHDSVSCYYPSAIFYMTRSQICWGWSGVFMHSVDLM